MKSRRRARGPCRPVVGVFCILLLAAPAAAEREYDFAKALRDRGYLDLAIEQYQRLLTLPGTSPEERLRARFDLAEVYQERAQETGEVALSRALATRAQAELDAVLKDAGGDVLVVFRARQAKATLLQNDGRHLLSLLAGSEFAGDRQTTRQEALKAFDESVTAFQALSEDAKALIAKVEKEGRPGAARLAAELQVERVNALLRGLWSRYYAALLFQEGEPQRVARLQDAHQGFAAFAKDWDGFLVSLYGHLGAGASLLELGEHEKARARFATVLLARRMPSLDAREVCAQALIYRAASFNATNQPAQALEDLDAALEFFPQPERAEMGRQALIEKARAYEQVALQMRAEDPTSNRWKSALEQGLNAARAVGNRPGPYQAQAIDLVTRLLTELGLTQEVLNAREALAVAQEAVRSQRYTDAVRAYRRAIELEGDPTSPLAARAWFGIGRAYYYLRWFREAAIVFGHVAAHFPASPDGGRAAYLGVQCWNLAYSASRQPAELQASIDSLNEALRLYAGDPKVVELRALKAQLLLREGKYEAALAAFRTVKEGSVGYAQAQYDAGMAAWDWFLNLLKRDLLGDDKGKAQYEAAIGHLKTYLRLVKDQAAIEEHDRIGRARATLATIYADVLGNAKEALTYVEGFTFPPDLEDQVLPLRLKGLIQQDRLDDALALLKQVRQATQANPERFRDLLAEIGRKLDEQAEALRKQGNDPAYRAAARRTADFLLGLLRDDPHQDPGMYQFVATRLIRIERYQEATEVLTQLIGRLGDDEANQPLVLAARLSLVECLMGAREWPEAISQLETLRKTYATSARLKLMLGTAYVERGSYQQGIELLGDLFRNVYKPGTRPWYEVGLLLARAYEKAGDPKRVLGVTGYVQVLYPTFWAGRDPENADLSDAYQEIHKRCGGK